MRTQTTLSKCEVTGKTRYSTPGDAKVAILKIKHKGTCHESITLKRIKRRVGRPDQCRYYLCQHCKGYHLTSWTAPLKKNTIIKQAKERDKNNKGLVVTQTEVADWKANSLPFPEPKNDK
jgi:hypothetical protein